MPRVFKKKIVIWERNGKRVPPQSPGAKKRTYPSSKWYGRVGGKPIPLSTDKSVAERMLAKLLADRDLKSVGLADPYAEHRRRPLLEHLEDYSAALIGRDNSPEHVDLSVARVQRLLEGIGAVYIADVDLAKATEWLNALRQPHERVELPSNETFTPSEVATLLGISGTAVRAAVKRFGLQATGKGKARRFPRETVQKLLDQAAVGCGPATINHYIRAARGFLRWMMRANRIPLSPLDSMRLLRADVDVRHARRELTAEEIDRLLAAAAASTKTFRGLTGEDRYFLYLTAVSTGFRASALASLGPEKFALDAQIATVTLPARFNKSRKLKVQPLPRKVADALREYLQNKPTGKRIWEGSWVEKRAAEMLRNDLEAAVIPYVVDGPEGPLYADFHSLRHSYLTLGGRAGIDLGTLQELAGHSSPLITSRYCHRRLHDLAGAPLAMRTSRTLKSLLPSTSS